MNLRSTLAVLSLTLGTLASATAFAYPPTAAHPSGFSRPAARPVVQGAVVQPIYAQPTYAQPVAVQGAVVRPVYAQPTYPQPAVARPAVAQRRLQRYADALRGRIARAEARLQVGRRGARVLPQGEFIALRAQIEGALNVAARDGALSAREQLRLEQMTARLERITPRDDGRGAMLRRPVLRR